MSIPLFMSGSGQGKEGCGPVVSGRAYSFRSRKQQLRGGSWLAYYVVGSALSLGWGSQTAQAQSACPTQIAGGPLVSPIVVDAGTTSPALNVGNDREVLVSSDAFVTSSLEALNLPNQPGAYAIDGAGGNKIIICGTIGTSAAPPALPGGGVRVGPDSAILVSSDGLIFGNRGGPAIAPGVELFGTGSSVTVDAGGQILGGFAPSIRGNAPVTVTNAGSIVVSGAGGFETSAIDLTGGVGSIITNSGTITSGSAAAIQFRNARGVVDGVSRITNSGTIVGTGGFFARSGGISLRRGLIEIANTGQIQNIQVGINADADGFAPQSGLTLVNQAGNIGMVIITASSRDFRPDLPYDLDLTNAAGATIGFIPGIELGTGIPLGESLVGISTLAAGRNRISNAGLILGTFNGIRFASGDTIITNLADAIIRNPDQTISFPAANEGYAIYGEGSITADVARPLIDNSGTIFGAFGGVNTRLGDATVINRSIRDASGTVIGGGSIGGGASGVTIGGGSIINEAGATISASNVRSPGSSGCIELRESFGVTCTDLRSAVFFTNAGLVGSLVNGGTITSQSRTTLLSFSPLSLYNGPTGRIENFGASFGAVEARNGLAADFVNEGVIRSSGTVVQITGTSGQSLDHDIINRGSIIGVNGATALLTFGSSARFVNDLGALVEGGISLQGVQNIPNGAGTSPTSGSVLNSGTINGGINLSSGGDVVNQATGSIVSTRQGFAAVTALEFSNPLNSFFNLTNSGTISGVDRGIHSVASRAQVTITNLTGGSIIANDPSNRSGRGDGINVRGTLTLVNQVGASIAGSRGGVAAQSAIDFNNAGTISGGLFGVDISNLLVSSSGKAIFRNSGSITTTQLFGVHAFIEDASRFENSGTISGGSAGLQVVGSTTRSVEISNSGQITSSSGNAVNLAGGSLTALENSGSIIASQNGLDLRNIADATIINQTGGLIDTTSAGGGWAGLAVFNGSGLIINQAGATISASAGTNEGGESAIFIGSEAGSVRVENDGVLSGVFTFSASNATDLVNRGSILATQVTDGDAINILLGGVFRNEAGANVTATRDAIFVFDDADNGTITEIHNTSGATITGDSDGNGTGHAIFADDGGQVVSGVERVFNAGSIAGDIFLGLNDDRLELASTGTITGDTSGGEGVDALRIDTATGSTRTLAEGQFAQFEDIVLNPTTGAAGRYVLTAAADPAAAATLDAGSTGSSLTLARGELNLRDTASSLRATTVSTAVGTLLSGNGTIFGDTSVAGTIAPGNSVGHLTIDGDLSLTATSLLDFELGQANVVGGPLNDLITVNGALVLDGLLTVKQSAGGSFTPGVYRLINYQGGLAALTDNILTIAGGLPGGQLGSIQTSVANQINLLVTAGSGPVNVRYWDGPNFTPGNIVGGRGGTAVWNSANTNWTNETGDANAPWDRAIGVFGGQTGLVTVEGSQAFEGLQFVTDAYHLVAGAAGALDLGTGGFIFVDTGLVAHISVGVNGAGRLDKQGDGRLLLDGVGGYAGGTRVTAGTLAVGSDTALGAGKVDLASGTTLQAAADVSLANAFTTSLQSGELVTIDTQSFDLTLATAIDAGNIGTVRKIGSGTLALSDGGSAGTIALDAGTLDVGGALSLAGGITAASKTQIVFNSTATLPTVQTPTGTGVQLSLAGENITIDVRAGARLNGVGGPLIRSVGPGSGPFSLTNAGSITARVSSGGSTSPGNANPDAIVVAGANGSTIVNSGRISGQNSGAAINFLDSRGANGVTSITNMEGGTLGDPSTIALNLQQGSFVVSNAGTLAAVRLDTDADADGFTRSNSSLDFTNLSGGVADTVLVGTSFSSQIPLTNTLESADFTAVNEAGASATGFVYGALGQFRVTNRGNLESAAVAAIRFAGDDILIINEAGGRIRQDGLTPESALFGTLPIENVAIFGANPALYGTAIPRIENSGNIIGTLRAIEVRGEAQIVNNSGGLIGIAPPTGGSVLTSNGDNFTVAIALADGFVENRAGAQIAGGVRIGGRGFDASDPQSDGYILNTGTITNDKVLLNPRNNTNLFSFGRDFTLDGVVFDGAARLYGATIGSAHTGTISGGRTGVLAFGALTEDLVNAGTISGGTDRNGPVVPGFVDANTFQEAGVFIVDANGHAVVNSGTISGKDAAVIFSDRFLFFPSPDAPFDGVPDGGGDIGMLRNLAGGEINGGVLFERLVPFDDPDLPFVMLVNEPESTSGRTAGRVENAGIIRGIAGNALNGAAIKAHGGVDLVNFDGGSILSDGNTFDNQFSQFSFLITTFVHDLNLDNRGLIQAGGTGVNLETPGVSQRDAGIFTFTPTATRADINIRNAATGRIIGGANGVAATGNIALTTAGVIRGSNGTGISVIGDLSLSVTELLANPDPLASPTDPLPPSIFGTVTGVTTAALIAQGPPNLNTPSDDVVVYGATARISNNGVIIGQSGDGLGLGGTSDVSNTNQIFGGTNGIAVRTLFVDNAARQRDLVDLTVANSGGTIVGGINGVLAVGGQIRLTNSGRIAGTAGNGIDIADATFTFNFAGPTPSTESENSATDIANASGGQIVGNIIGVNVARLADAAADPDSIALNNFGTITGGDAGVVVGDLNGSTIINRTAALIAGQGAGNAVSGIRIGAGSGSIINEVGATIRGSRNGDGFGGAIRYQDGASAGNLAVTNAGLLDGDVYFSGGNDSLTLLSSGTIAGVSAGGSGVDALRIDTATGSTRTLAEGQFAQFEDIVLNPTTGAAGRYVLTAAADPAATATLDAGSTGSSLTLARGELNLRDTASSLRATTVSTAAGTLLSGNGTIFGDTSVAGTIAPGNSVGHLTIDGDLSLTATSLLDFELGQANVVGGPLNDLITVNGSLVLDGILTVAQSAGGSFTPGVYRLINYQGGLGALTDNGLDLGGLLPNGLSGVVQTSIGNQVNLVIAGVGVDISYWDGINFSTNGLVDGGPGVWNSSNTNFTLADGSANAPWDNDIGVFAGPAGGVVSVEGVQGFTGLQFVTDEYRIVRGETGAGLTLGTGGFIFVDSGIDARFDLGIAGSGALNKQGDGRLILTEANAYVGGTAVNGGTLAIGHNIALGLGGLQLANGTTLQAFTPGLNLANAVSLVGSGAVVATADTQTFDLTLSGQLAGAGRLVKAGTGALSIATGGQLAGVDVTGGRFNLVGTASLDLQASLTLADATELNLAQGAVLNAGLLGVLGDAGRQTITSAGTINGAVALGDGADAIDLAGTISGRIDLDAGDDTLTLLNSGSIGPSASGGAGTDRLVFAVNIGATRAIDGLTFAAFEDIEKSAGGTLRVATGTLAGQTLHVGEGALELAGSSAVTLSGGASLVGTTRLDLATGASLSAASIGGDAASQTITNAGTINGAVALGDGVDAIDIVGRANGTIDLGAGDDGLILRASGAVTAAAQGGSGTDTLAINTAASADRTIDDGIFIGFEDIALNTDADALGRFVLTAASDPQGRATLDAGTGFTSTIRLARGELNLRDAASSLRAASLDIGSTALLSGVGSVYTGAGSTPSGRLNVAGTISPGNAIGSIGTLRIIGGYQQSGTYVVDYRPPADLTNIVNGAILGRNSLNTPGLAAGSQDADLLVVNGAGTLTGGSVLLRPQGSAAQFAAVLTAPGNDRAEIRYQVLHADGGLGNTRLVALSAGDATLEYPSANDVDLVIRGEVGPVLVLDGPPPEVVIDRVIGDALGQQLATNLPRTSYDCDVPTGSATLPPRNTCLFGQVTRSLGSLPTAAVSDARAASFTPDSLYTGFLHRISNNWRLGLGFGYSTTDQQLHSVDDSESEGAAFALLVRRNAGPMRYRASAGGGLYRARYSRSSLFGDGRSLTGAFDARFFNGTVEAERWYNANEQLSFAPRASVDWRVEWRDAFVETGDALDRFSARTEKVVRARTSFGGVARIKFQLGSAPAFVEPAIAWDHELGDVVTSVTGQYVGQPDIAIQSAVRSLPRDSFQFSLGGAVEVSEQAIVRFQYNRIDNAGRSAQSIALRLSASF